MPSINFLLAIHNHQPVGNFDAVIEDAYQQSYRPLLETLSRHPRIPVAMHHSGCLLDWLSEHRPEYLEALGTQIRAGHVEPLTGGYYEPILSSIPEADRLGQITKLSAWLEARFGVPPRGLWLTERVWEPSLASSLARAEVGYTMVDDTHFISAGLDPDALWASYITEDQGLPLVVLPISKALRYLIPFRPPEETITFLRELAERAPGCTALLGDDGEKFGVWPNTHQLVYTEGWLEQFLTLLEAESEWLHVRLPGDVVQAEPPAAKVYLPTASYEEMMEWSLPAATQSAFHATRTELAETGRERFAGGGFWRNFFSRYPESDHLNKRVMQVGRALSDVPKARQSQIQDELWAAQCNCAYWHGVFGGLYLPHLRNALYEHLLGAEHALETATHSRKRWAESSTDDFDCDGEAEVFLRNPDLTLVLSPREGGALQELSIKPLRVALGNVLTRRFEAYHTKVRGAVAPGEEQGSKSIHDLVLAKETGLDALLNYDKVRRGSLQDHFLRDEDTLERFARGSASEQGDFLTGEFAAKLAAVAGGASASLTREGTVWRDGEPRSLRVTKILSLAGHGATFTATLRVDNLESTSFHGRYGAEWNLAMLAPNSPDHRYRIPGVTDAESHFASQGETLNVPAIELFDRHRGFVVRMAWSQPATLWRAPVETVSLSEGGFERIFQSALLFPWWSLSLAPEGSFEVSCRVEVASL